MTSPSPVAGRGQPRGFSNEESFGLFMEAVRELQMYEDEAMKSASQPASLQQHLQDALDALEQCHRLYPDDLLPRYYLGIALTMENQCLYAMLLRERQPQLPAASAAPAAFSDPSGDDTGTPLPPLPDRAWPLLDRALDCFNRNGDFALVPELKDAALFNSANVCVRLATPDSYNHAIAILQELLNRRAVTRAPGRFAWLTAWSSTDLQQRRENEAKAFGLSTQILLAAARALRAIRLHGPAAEPEFDAALTELMRCGERAANEITDAVAKHDVLADALTKRGVIKYFFAVSALPWSEETIENAAADFQQALQHKGSWMAAQIYLAQAYQALGHPRAAEQQLSAVLGMRAAPSKAA